MNNYFLVAKALLSAALAYYRPAFIPFIGAYWLGVAFLFWRGKRGLAPPGAPRVAVDYLGGYPGLTAPQTLWLTVTPQALTSGGLRLPHGAIRRLKLLRHPEGEALARSQGYEVTSGEGDLFLEVLWRDGEGTERELLFQLPRGRGAADMSRLVERVEALRLEEAVRRRKGP